ncbi:MAG: metallophosphoesterase [Leptolyngbya sp. SIO4C1]|nr:metallophosphoesterase [Leptolyngbya sp. SIO4C1]
MPIVTGPLTVERLTVPIADLPARLAGTTVVQLSDLHYDGLLLTDELLARAVDEVRSLSPDLIVLTGDYVTRDPTPIYTLARQLKQLSSRYGLYAVLGNHDRLVSGAAETITHALEQVDIRVLWNQIAYPFGETFPLVGLADFWSSAFRPAPIFEQLDPAVPRLVLSHNPDSAEVLSCWRVDLQLSGHTHGGQIVFPGIGNAPQLWDLLRRHIPAEWRKDIPYLSDQCFKIVKHWEWAMGLHRVGSNWLYVNRGLGTYPPGRLFCPPEITLLTLQPAQVKR